MKEGFGFKNRIIDVYLNWLRSKKILVKSIIKPDWKILIRALKCEISGTIIPIVSYYYQRLRICFMPLESIVYYCFISMMPDLALRVKFHFPQRMGSLRVIHKLS